MEQLAFDFGRQVGDAAAAARVQRQVMFFAIMPDAGAAAAMAALSRRLAVRYGLSGRPLSPGRLYLSLLGFGAGAGVREDLVAVARRVGAAAGGRAFEVDLPVAMTFKGGARVLCCGYGAAAALTGLRDALWTAADDVGLALRGRAGFTPHVTLAYDRVAMPDTLLPEPICWPARELVLILSEQGRGRHTRLGRWPLRGGC